MVPKRLLTSLSLVTLLLVLFLFTAKSALAQNFGKNYRSVCPRDFDGNLICPSYSLDEDFCVDGNVIEGREDDCGCKLPPSCQEPTPKTSPTLPNAPLSGDLNLDGKLDNLDLQAMRNLFLKPDTSADLNDDSKVDLLDYTILVNRINNQI